MGRREGVCLSLRGVEEGRKWVAKSREGAGGGARLQSLWWRLSHPIAERRVTSDGKI